MFYGFVITEAGNRLLARQVAGDHLDISRAVMDKGTCESDEAARVLTAPIDPGPNGVYTVPVWEGTNVNFLVEYRSDLNGGLKEDFWIGGFGVYVRNPDFDPEAEVSEDNPEEIMVYYGSLGDAKQKVKAYVPGSVPDTRRYPVSLEVTTGVEVGTAWPAEAWMTADDVKKYVEGTLAPELRASLTVLIEAHDENEQAHEGMRELAEQAKEESAAAPPTRRWPPPAPRPAQPTRPSKRPWLQAIPRTAQARPPPQPSPWRRTQRTNPRRRWPLRRRRRRPRTPYRRA